MTVGRRYTPPRGLTIGAWLAAGAWLTVGACLAAGLALVSTPAARAEPQPAVTIIFGGDVLIHTPLWNQAARNARRATGRTGYDFRPMFDDIRGILSRADLAVCHLETPIAPPDEPLSTFPLFGVPREVIPALADAGFDRCSTASNHTLDRGVRGIDATVGALLAHGISQTGMARRPDEIRPTVIEVNGLRIAHLSYTFSYNGLKTPVGEPWRSALIDPRRIIRDAKTARLMGAQTVIVSLHWGTEKRSEPNSYQLDVAERLTRSRAIDLIIGHHAHVVQPIANVNGTWVAYGLSNLISNLPTDERWPVNSQDGVLVEVTISRTSAGVVVSRPRAYATWVDKDASFVVRLAADAARSNTLPERTSGDARKSLARTAAIVGEFLVRP